MINQKQKHSDTIYEHLNKYLPLSETQKKLLFTVKDDKFPGAIIPTENLYYIVSSSEKEWRLLFPMIKAFMSPSVVEPSCAVKHLDQHNPIDKVLMPLGLKSVLKVPVPKNTIANHPADKVYEKIFERMYELYKQTVFHQVSYPEHTSVLLERFKDALKFNDDFEALSCMQQIKNEQRLDALNIIFMEIEYFYAKQDWQGIMELDQLDQVLITRKPLQIRMHLVETLYYTYLENDINNPKRVLKLITRHFLSLLSVKCPANATDIVKTVYFIAVEGKVIDSSSIDKIIGTIDDNKILLSETKQNVKKIYTDTNQKDIEDSKVDIISVRAVTIEASNEDSVESITKAKEQFEQLPVEDQLIIEETLTNDDIVEKEILPTSWIEWVSNLSNEEFLNSQEIAEKGVEEWLISEQLNDTVSIKNIVEEILGLNELGVKKFIKSTPDIIEALARDVNYPNTLHLPLYIGVLELISLNDVQDHRSLYITQDLTSLILELGPNREEYKETMEYIGIIVEHVNGKKFINWLLDYAEIIISENSKDEQLKNSVIEKILNNLYNQSEWIEEYHLKLIFKIASTVDLVELFSEISFEADETQEDPWEKYTNSIIGIYSLTESALRHAQEYLEEHIEGVRVITNHDKAATTALQNMANVSDYQVLVTQSAKHAATGEIQKILRKKNKDPLFSKGKGSSSIIAALIEG